ncbi:hypothetical protein PV08_05888 [Exophiala spinifera]|uniref:Asparaginase n=1 Tax=Exophiala spinifera TaxID=91928 RepID=A0A0D2BA14_9EURO|nr:uncharacterized protein PV08_05888 [Exophiala spinifera]KIW15838.1 hypothetical protein PV08_05888 [Exophiala spinifera]
MNTPCTEKHRALGPFEPTVILHGGAGAISRASLPPELWARYEASLLKYLADARKLLDSGASALDAACAAATWFEDDPLFNCGRGSVFTEQGTIEMEASVMVCSLDPSGSPAGQIKRGAAVSLIRNTRHPILLAREVLLAADGDQGMGGTSTMHCHLSGRDVEEWGWKEKALEEKPDRWFWTRKRWEEHRRGLNLQNCYTYNDLLASTGRFAAMEEDGGGGDGVHEYPSQGTVGAVCLDSWGNLAVATSTGGLTNKKAGRIGDTPTIGSGFWAETWEEQLPATTSAVMRTRQEQDYGPITSRLLRPIGGVLGSCLNLFQDYEEYQPVINSRAYNSASQYRSPLQIPDIRRSTSQIRRRAVAMSGTGNGDSFLRTNAARTAASMCRFSSSISLTHAVNAIAGPGGELQQSAGDRWGLTGEGEGGIIGIEIDDGPVPTEFSVAHGYPHSKSSSACLSTKKRGRVVFDFNCGGLFRAFYELEERTGKETPKVMVFKKDY